MAVLVDGQDVELDEDLGEEVRGDAAHQQGQEGDLFLKMAFRAKGSRSWANQHMGFTIVARRRIKGPWMEPYTLPFQGRWRWR
jgi:hypothetical protein